MVSSRIAHFLNEEFMGLGEDVNLYGLSTYSFHRLSVGLYINYLRLIGQVPEHLFIVSDSAASTISVCYLKTRHFAFLSASVKEDL